MKVRIFTLLIVLAVMASSITACKQKDSYFIEILKTLPNDIISVDYLGVELIREDADFKDDYIFLTDNIFTAWVPMLGLDFSDIQVIVYADDADEYKSGLMVSRGEFDLQNIRNALMVFPEHEFVQDQYEGIEIWIGDPDSNEPLGIALLENLLFIGDVDYMQDAVRVSQKKEPSLYDNEDIKSVADRLSSGIQAEIYIGEIASGIPILAGGRAFFNSNQGDEILNIEGYYKLGSATDAETTLQDLLDSYQWRYVNNIDSRLIDDFIEVTGEMDISDY